MTTMNENIQVEQSTKIDRLIKYRYTLFFFNEQNLFFTKYTDQWHTDF